MRLYMKKVSEQHLAEIHALKENLLQIISNIGELHLNKVILTNQINEIDSEIKSLENKFSEFQKNEAVLYKTLEETYGSGSIDLDTGEITE